MLGLILIGIFGAGLAGYGIYRHYNSQDDEIIPSYPSDSRIKVREDFMARGVIFGKVGSQTAYSPGTDEGHIAVFGGTGLGKTMAVLVPTLRRWVGTAFVIDIAGDICKNIFVPNKTVYEPENPHSAPYDIFAQIDSLKSVSECNEELANLAHLTMPIERNDNSAAEYFKTEGRKMLIASLIYARNLSLAVGMNY